MNELDELKQKLTVCEKQVSDLLIEYEGLKLSKQEIRPTNHDSETWDSREFKKIAKTHRDACDLILKNAKSQKPANSVVFAEIYYLSGYILECIIKSFILETIHKKTATKKELMDDGLWTHDINNLWKKACDLGKLRKQDFSWGELAKVWDSEIRYKIHKSEFQDGAKVKSHYHDTVVKIHDNLKSRY